MGPNGKKREKLIQPTLVSFMNIKCWPVGPGASRGGTYKPSSPSNLKATGRELPLGASQGSLMEYGERGGRPRMIQKESPEHNLLTEVKVVAQGGGHLPGRKKGEMRASRDPVWSGLITPEGKEGKRPQYP